MVALSSFFNWLLWRKKTLKRKLLDGRGVIGDNVHKKTG